VRSGAFYRRITVERKAISTDAEYVAPDANYGTANVIWVPLVKVGGVAERFWAEVQDALPSRSESVTQGLEVARNQTRIRMRYRDDIDSSMRVKLHGDGNDVVYQIVGGPATVTKEGRKNMIELVCERYSS
jgi:head-tail adaptor